MSVDWQWQEMTWHQAITPAAAGAGLERLATAVELGPVVLELRVGAEGAHWLVGTGTHRGCGAAELLSGLLPVRVHPPAEGRRPVSQAARLLAAGDCVSDLPERVAAAVRALYAAMTGLSGEQGLVVQLLLGRRLSPAFFTCPQTPLWYQLLNGYDAPPSSHRAARPADEQHGAAACLRLGCVGGPDWAHRRLARLLGALRVVETARARLRLSGEAPERLDEAARPWRYPLRLRSGQLAALSGWPIGEPPLPLLGGLHPLLVAPPPETGSGSSRRVIGVGAAPGSGRTRVRLPIQDAVYHTHLLGPTGVGKSTLMLSLALADAAEGRGLLLLDPKGDLAADLLARIPEQRADDVVVIDPANPAPVGLNPLAGPEHQAPATAEALVAVLAALFKDNWGIRTADVLSAALLTLARTPGANLLWLVPLLTNPAFRRRVLAMGPPDPLGTGAFWKSYEAKRPQGQATEIAPVLNKLRQLIMRPGLRAVLGQSAPRLDLRDILTRRRIVVVNLNRARLGAGASRLLGSLLLAQLWHHLLSRQALVPERRHIISVFIDEVHDFLAGLPDDLSDALAQSRSLGAAFHLAHQYRAQLSPQMIQAIETNARNKIYFNLSGTDAAASARLAPGLEAADFQLLGRYRAYAHLIHRGRPTDWFTIATEPAPPPLRDPADLYAASHTRYGIPAQTTETELLHLIDPPPERASDRTPAPIGRARR